MKYAKVYAEDVQVGSEMPPLVKPPIQQIQLTRYAGASGDFNPIHHDQTFAEASGNPTVFAMGMLNAGILTRVVTKFVGRPAVRKYKVRFAQRAWPGDDVICTGKVTRKFEEGKEKRIEGEIQAVNQKGDVLISGGFEAALPSRS